jgi:hypothetical protein
MLKESWRISRSTSGTNPGRRAWFARFGSFSFGRRIEVQIESKFRECLERYGEKKAVFLRPFIVAYYAAE